MAVLHLVRERGRRLSTAIGTSLLAVRARPLLVACLPLLALGACRGDPELEPDEVLQAELGLTTRDRVYRVEVEGGPAETATPATVGIEPGAYVEFITIDGFVHEVIFEADSLRPDQRGFLQGTDQSASPPLLSRGSRYVLAFDGAPPGRYPYVLLGNGADGRGVIVVDDPRAR